jgi:hypothetical protein
MLINVTGSSTLAFSTLCKDRGGTFGGVAGIYYANALREAFELWSPHIGALTSKKAAAV